MQRLHFSGVALALLLFALAAPARSANVLQLTVANGAQSNVVCPVKLQFSGLVFAQQYVPFEYWFITLVNGVEETTPKKTIVPLTSGNTPVTFSLGIASSSDQTTTNIVELDAADIGQPPTRSQQVPFSVSCSKAVAGGSMFKPLSSVSRTDKATPDPRAVHPISGIFIPLKAPSGLTATKDPSLCAQHLGLVGGFVCTAALPTGGLALVWDNQACEACVEGYHLYRIDQGRHDLAETQPASHGTASVFNAERGPFEGRCYAVTAYQGRQESAASAPVCIGGGQIARTETFRPTNQRSFLQYSTIGTGFNGLFYRDGSGGENKPRLRVGFYHRASKRLLGDDSANGFSRGALLYDLAKLSGKSILKAVLHLQVIQTTNGTIGDLETVDHSTSCTTRIGSASARWWNYTDAIEGIAPPGGMYDTRGPDVDLNVTAIVQSWANNSGTNFGFVLYGASEELAAFTNADCMTDYVDASTLEVTHY